MELTKLSEDVLRKLKVGDVVAVDREWTGRGKIVAPIIAVEQRWGTNALPLVTLEGHDPNWAVGSADERVRHEDSLQFGAHCVLEIVSLSSYVCAAHQKRNRFAEHVAEKRSSGYYWNDPRLKAPKGQWRGMYREMAELFILALAKLPYELTTSFHDDRAMKLWVKAGRPGLVRAPDKVAETDERQGRSLGSILGSLVNETNEHYFVREKPFCRFVRQNWSSLVMTRAEMNKEADEYMQWDLESNERDMDDNFPEDDDPDSSDDRARQLEYADNDYDYWVLQWPEPFGIRPFFI